MARRTPAPPSRPVVAMCTWEDYNYPECMPGSATYRPGAPTWTTYGDDEPTACRASLGGRILTVWLPKGAVIRCRVHRDSVEPMRGTYQHVYGSHDRMSRTRIRMRLTDLPRS